MRPNIAVLRRSGFVPRAYCRARDRFRFHSYTFRPKVIASSAPATHQGSSSIVWATQRPPLLRREPDHH